MGLDLHEGESYAGLVDVLSKNYPPMKGVVPGEPDSSVLYLKVMGDSRTGSQMPLEASPLSSVQTDDIKTWTLEGVQNN